MVSTRADRAPHQQAVWLVEVRMEDVDYAPWWLLTDRPVETVDQTGEVFTMDPVGANVGCDVGWISERSGRWRSMVGRRSLVSGRSAVSQPSVTRRSGAVTTIRERALCSA